jgi:gamma-glutamylcyclotransferase (GGCT)/AIG2-like uncharacterized protein YtfP
MTGSERADHGLALIAPDDTLPLFVYGTLLEERFLARLLGHPVPSRAARLEGWEVVELSGLPWPVIRPLDPAPDDRESPGDTGVEGQLYLVAGAEDYHRLDAYEGVGEGLYQRTTVQVRITPDDADLDRTQPQDRTEPRARASLVTANVYIPTSRTLKRWG